MATSYEQALKNLRAGGLKGTALKQAENSLSGYYGSKKREIDPLGYSTTRGEVLGASTSDASSYDGAGEFGAGGRGEFKPGTSEKQKKQNRKDQDEAINYGVSGSEIGDYSQGKASQRGMGITDPIVTVGPYKGKKQSEANQLRREQGASQSSLTSYSYNPETISGTKKRMENFNLRVKETMADTWNGKGTKEEKVKGIYESTANDISKLFTKKEDFDALYGSNLDFKNAIDAYSKAGGDTNAIKNRIQAPMMDMPMQETGMPESREQTNQEYLSKLTLKADPNSTLEEQEAFNSLIPEREIAQKQIQKLAKVSDEYKDLYFGTPEVVGILEEKRIQAEEKVKITQRKMKDDENDLKAQANHAIAISDAEQDIEEAKVEENRLAAKNYMTGMLAKLGALNTTGAAPQVLATLEQKYQQQAQQLRSSTRLYKREVQIKLKDAVNDLEVERDNDILKVSQDLTKDKETVLKETMKREQQADKEIGRITEKAARDLRARTEKYVKEAKTEADKFISKQESLLRVYNPAALLKKYDVPNVAGKSLTAKGKGTGSTGTGKTAAKTDITQRIEASRGDDDKVDPAVYLQASRDWVENGLGSRSTFITAFPPAKYVNPENDTLPEGLRVPKSTTKAKSSTSRQVIPE